MIMNNMYKTGASLATVAIVAAVGFSVMNPAPALAARANKAQDAIWAHGELYDTVITDTAFKSPPTQSTDVIFSFGDSGLEGQRSVADAAPGDPKYNGGRWNVMLVTFTELGMTVHDPDGDGVVNFELMDAETVLAHAELGHLEITAAGVYFECPMIPNEGRN
jgi:hypothetical protein